MFSHEIWFDNVKDSQICNILKMFKKNVKYFSFFFLNGCNLIHHHFAVHSKRQPVKILFSPIILHNSKHQHSAGVCCYLVLCVKIKPKCLLPQGAFSPVVPC